MKERLTGAIILVVLVVLLVPELLSGPTRSAPAPQVSAASQEEPPLRSYTIDLADDSRTKATPAASEAGTVPAASAPEMPATIIEPSDSGTPGADSTPAPKPEMPSVASTPSPSVVRDTVQETPSPAARPPEVVRKAAAPERIASSERPAPTATSERVAAPAANSAEKPASSSSGWTVQVGSFASRANAEHLARQLKDKGIHTTVSQSNGPRKLWRVRTVAVADRAAAEQQVARLKAVGQSGAIVPK